MHGVPLSIISDTGTQYTLTFWSVMKRELDTQLDLSIDFHPYKDG